MDAQLHSRELSITRVFDAPRDLVFKAWTDARMLAEWFGPQGFTNPICKCDARVGGEIYVVMRANDEIAKAMGFRDAPMRGEFRQVDPPKRLVFTNNAVDADDNVILNGLTTVTFEEVGRKTKMTFHTVASGTQPQVVFMLQGMEAGWTQSFDKLDAMFAGKLA
ncbi:MAG TPA: SRPBCC domain-containing protein [Rhizomicrobium sp.]|jgi:uncharacterized protein YndB with AHSA1/START domain